jgi:predicted hydrolase (HD superfamily)
MLPIAAAVKLVHHHLGDTARARHSRLVGTIMRYLAQRLSAEADFWEIVGLCHDLDVFAVGDDRARHGVLAAQWLNGQLPEEALTAIAAHDHRTGIQADTLLADMLKLADAAAIIAERLAAESLPAQNAIETVGNRLGGRSYVADIVARQSTKHGLVADDVLRFAVTAARVDSGSVR